MAARLPRETTTASCVTPGMPAQTATAILKLLVSYPHSPLLDMVQHVGDWVAPFSRNQHSPPPPLKLFHIPTTHPPLLLNPPFRVRELEAIIIK